jgi:5-methylcytosine-specific restriction protein B
LVAEMLWALLLFPSNVKPRTKRRQVQELWAMAGSQLPDTESLLSDAVLTGIGSGGPGFNTYRPGELEFLIEIARKLKGKSKEEREALLRNYHTFVQWISTVRQKGHRQFRHMLRYFAFPDLVERMSSNRDRRKVLEGFKVVEEGGSRAWSDLQLDEGLLKLRRELEAATPGTIIDFYAPGVRERWAPERKVKTIEGEVTVVVPTDDEDDDVEESGEQPIRDSGTLDVRQSVHIQAKLAEIGAIMGFKIWVPRADRIAVRNLIQESLKVAFIDDLPLSYDETTLGTIALIDVL